MLKKINSSRSNNTEKISAPGSTLGIVKNEKNYSDKIVIKGLGKGSSRNKQIFTGEMIRYLNTIADVPVSSAESSLLSPSDFGN
jgi:hypothetical protein